MDKMLTTFSKKSNGTIFYVYFSISVNTIFFLQKYSFG